MALSKAIQTDYGVDATYWRIAKVSDAFHGAIEVTMHGYADAMAAKRSAVPLASIAIWVEGIEETRATIYPYIKNVEPFINAADA